VRRTGWFDFEAGKGGPGRGLIQIAAGMEKSAHHTPETRTASWRLFVVDPVRMTRGIVVS
jgi:hypothetical protein